MLWGWGNLSIGQGAAPLLTTLPSTHLFMQFAQQSALKPKEVDLVVLQTSYEVLREQYAQLHSAYQTLIQDHELLKQQHGPKIQLPGAQLMRPSAASPAIDAHDELATNASHASPLVQPLSSESVCTKRKKVCGCGMSFRDSYNLKRHVRRQHPEKSRD